jgi:hypothetical protein
VPANVAYARYVLSYVLQVQFHRALSQGLDERNTRSKIGW